MNDLQKIIDEAPKDMPSVSITDEFGVNYLYISNTVHNLSDLRQIVELRGFLSKWVALVEDDSSEDFLYEFNEVKALLAKGES